MSHTIIDIDNISVARPKLASSAAQSTPRSGVTNGTPRTQNVNAHANANAHAHANANVTATQRSNTPRTNAPRTNTPRSNTPRQHTYTHAPAGAPVSTAVNPPASTAVNSTDNHGWTKQARSLVKLWTVQTSLNRKYHQREAVRMDNQSKILKITIAIFGSSAAFVSFINAAFTADAYVHIILNILSGLLATVATLLGVILSTLNLDIDGEKNRQTAVQYGNISNEGQSLLVEQNESTMPLATDFLRRMKDLTYLIQLFGPPLDEQDGSDLPNLVLMKGLNIQGNAQGLAQGLAPTNEYDGVFGEVPEHKKSRKELLNGILDDAADIKRRREALQAEEAELNDLRDIIAKKVGLKPSDSSEYIAGGANLDGEVTLGDLMIATQKLNIPLRMNADISSVEEYESNSSAETAVNAVDAVNAVNAVANTDSLRVADLRSTSPVDSVRRADAQLRSSAQPAQVGMQSGLQACLQVFDDIEDATGGADNIARYHNRVRIDADELRLEIEKRRRDIERLKIELDSRESQNRGALDRMKNTPVESPQSPVKKLVDRIRKSTDSKPAELPHEKTKNEIIEKQREKLEALQAATDTSFYEDLAE
jgi:hypothetical protein